MNIAKSKYKDGFVPKHSNPNGYEDEGISSVLEKPISFRYSHRFLKWFYTEMGEEE